MVIVASAGAVGFARRIGFPPIVGYLVAGLAIGPHGLAILAPSEGTEFLSELGVRAAENDRRARDGVRCRSN